MIVGGGPAGLTAAVYLARFRRRVAVFDTGASRARWIPTSHNLPGFPDGMHGEALLEKFARQIETYGLEVSTARVDDIGGGLDQFEVRAGERRLTARTVLIATGIVEILPPVPHIAEGVKSGRVRVCPICDGYEAMDRRLAVLGRGDHAAREAMFLRTYSADVTLALGPEDGISEEMQGRLAEAGIPTIRAELDGVGLDDAGAQVEDRDGQVHRFELLYAAFGVTAQTRALRSLGPQTDEQGRLVVDDHQQTSVEGIYAAGDIVRGLNQIAVAEGEAAIAATAIHNRLPPVRG